MRPCSELVPCADPRSLRPCSELVPCADPRSLRPCSELVPCADPRSLRPCSELVPCADCWSHPDSAVENRALVSADRRPDAGADRLVGLDWSHCLLLWNLFRLNDCHCCRSCSRRPFS